jgi:SAM-dependent methyltransferase
MDEDKIKQVVREGYAKVAKGQGSCCGPKSSVSSCCGGESHAQTISESIGYSKSEISEVPDGANLGLGCGNPIALASLKTGEIVLDLGAGAGFDCFLAANRVGSTGKVIGVDMTPEMIEKARQNARKGGFVNVEFRLGEIENLPVADNSVDVVISNCVINLASNKDRVFAEAFRAIRPGGRVMVSDLILDKELPDYIKSSVAAYVGCLSGAMLKDDYLGAIKRAGFIDVHIIDEKSFPIDDMLNDETAQALLKEMKIPIERLDSDVQKSVLSVKVSARKPND